MTLRRRIAASLVAVVPVLLAVACGAGRSSEAPASAPEKSAPADEAVPQSAPAGAAAPAQAPAPSYAPAPAEEAPRGYGAAPAPAPRKPAGPASTRSEREQDGEDSSEFAALTSQFEKALALSTPDCTLSWALRDKICDLSQRLCDLAGRSAEPEMDGRCRDGRARCEHATARVRAVCAE